MMVTYVDTYIHIHTYVYIYIYIYIYIFIYMYTHMHVYIYVYIILSVIVFFSSLSFYGEWTIPGTKRQPAILNLIDGGFLISSRVVSGRQRLFRQEPTKMAALDYRQG